MISTGLDVASSMRRRMSKGALAAISGFVHNGASTPQPSLKRSKTTAPASVPPKTETSLTRLL